MDKEITVAQNVILENRQRLELSGILDVSSFSDTFVEANYSDGCIAVEGEQLKIEEFSSEIGILRVNGIVNAFYYYKSTPRSKKKLFHG